MKVLHEHLGAEVVDIVLTNIGKVPNELLGKKNKKEYLLQVEHNFSQLQELVPFVISDDFLTLYQDKVYHNGPKVAEELFKKAFEIHRMPKKSFQME